MQLSKYRYHLKPLSLLGPKHINLSCWSSLVAIPVICIVNAVRVLDMYTSNTMYSMHRIEYIVHFFKVKPSYSCQCASLILLMLYLFLCNAEMCILSSEVYANERNIILKHTGMFITISFVFITTSSKRVTIYCIASEHYENNFPKVLIIIRDEV